MYADAYLAQTDGAYSDAPGPDHAAVPLADCPFCFFGGVRCGGLTGGWWAISAALDGCRGGVSLWCAGRGWASALWWMRCGGSVASALWWMQCNEVLAVFVEGFLLTFDGGVVILKVHIWEHSGPFGYLIPIWLVV